MNIKLNESRDNEESTIAIWSDYSSDLIDVFEIEDINKSNNLTESTILSLQKFLIHHKWIVTIELTIWTSKEQIDALLKWLKWIMEIQWIDLIDHQNGFITIETDISDSPLEVEVLGKSLRWLIWVNGVQVNILSDLYSVKRTFEDIQAIEEMIIQ